MTPFPAIVKIVRPVTYEATYAVINGSEFELRSLARTLGALKNTDPFSERLTVHDAAMKAMLLDLGIAKASTQGSVYRSDNFDAFVNEIEEKFDISIEDYY